MRAAILNTAMGLFLEDGFDKVTMRRIAAKIEYSPATIYLYFKDKGEILLALHNEGFEKFFKKQKTILAEKDSWKRLRKHASIYLSFALENPEYYQLMFMERGITEEIQKNDNWEMCFRSAEFLKTNIQECIEDGYLPEADLDAASFAYWSLMHGMASLIIRKRVILVPENQIGRVVEQAIDFILDNMKKA